MERRARRCHRIPLRRPGAHHLPYETETRLIALLEEVGSPCEPRLRENQPCPVGYMPRHMDFAPAGMEMWGYSADVRFVKDATLTFDLAVLGERLAAHSSASDHHAAVALLRRSGLELGQAALRHSERPRSVDATLWRRADRRDRGTAFLRSAGPGVDGRGLAPWQLRRVVEYLDAHLPERVDLALLAALVGLSQSHFSRAFKASTGMAPYHWQLDARMRRAQALLIDTRASLDRSPKPPALPTPCILAVHSGNSSEQRRQRGVGTAKTDLSPQRIQTGNRRIEQCLPQGRAIISWPDKRAKIAFSV